MPIGLKRGIVELADHDPQWEELAADTIERLWRVFGEAAKDIQHVGSTAIKGIKAKPIIDIAVAVRDFDEVEKLMPLLAENGWTKSVLHAIENDMLIVDDNELADTRTHHIHIVLENSVQWKNYICFRDYLNSNGIAANEYNSTKQILVKKYPNDRNAYTYGKDEIVTATLQEARIWDDFGRRFIKIESITKGWSEDKKFYIEAADGRCMLLRVSDIAELERKKTEYSMMERVYALGVLTSEPLGFGLCDDGKSCYSLSGWLDGEDAEKALPFMSETEQYITGLRAGAVLKNIHSLPTPENVELWNERFQRKVQERIDFYNTNLIKSENRDIIISYLQENKHLLESKSQTFIHGDFNISNMMIMPDGQIGVIDFNAFNKDYGDPWWEFHSASWDGEKSAHFFTGILKEYFNGDPPNDFFNVLSYYFAYDVLTGLCNRKGEAEDENWATENIDICINDMNNPVPSWYLKDFYIQYIDGIPYKLKAPFDFSFLSKYGKVFKVFDSQDSGNICFGIQAENGKRYFIKFAGAPTAEYVADTESAVDRLKAAVPVYRDLAHPNLIKFIDAEEIGGGFAMIFEWVDGICAHPMYPNDYRKFKQIPLANRLQMYEDILDFHAFVAEQGYTAVDFYDGSIMWDIVNERVLICDIDFYKKSKAYGSKFLWGHMQSASPEERTDGTEVDEISNVYNMGETAFTLFIGRKSNRSREGWPLSDALYTIAKKAVNDDRSQRQQSIEQLITEWRAAK